MPDPSPFQRLRARILFPAIVILAVALMFVLDLLAGGERNTSAPMGAMLVVYAAMVLVLAIGGRLTALRWHRLFGPASGDIGWPLIAVAIPLALLSYGGFWLLWVPLSYFAPAFVEAYALEGMPDLLTRDNPAQLALDIVAIIVVAPIVEELLFRGVLLHRWSHRWGTAAGVVLSSLAFAVLHVELIGHFIFAVAMAALYVRTRSLWIPIGAHALNNALAVVLSIPEIMRGGAPNVPTLQEFRSEWQPAAVALMVALAALVFLWRRIGPRAPWVLPYVAASEQELLAAPPPGTPIA